jgi:hypothetical protein
LLADSHPISAEQKHYTQTGQYFGSGSALILVGWIPRSALGFGSSRAKTAHKKIKKFIFEVLYVVYSYKTVFRIRISINFGLLDPHWKCGSGSALEMRIRIQQGKSDPQK